MKPTAGNQFTLQTPAGIAYRYVGRHRPSDVFHADPFLVALLLLVAGVLGSVLPLVPGGLLSTAGVVYYRLVADLGPLVTLLLVTLGLFALAVDWFGGAVSARAGGASLRTTAAAVIGGLALAVVLGPLGLVAGVFGVVFALEYRRHRNARQGARTAVYATAGILVSTVMQVLLTATMLAVFLVAI
ncbi:DUF456 domain-containing protein [Halobacteriales archaeon QS_1_68_44]|nr:MAG: DUF456 domain-containing protein [Halobacteriales archaeon QS_1_68_44]